MAHEREASVERIIAFSDGVVAIAITLLILPLTEIHAAQGATLADIVVENGAELGSFALSFAVIANYWTIHHNLFPATPAPQWAHCLAEYVLACRDRLSTVSDRADRGWH
jgi:uncharacterized membrane protein